MPGCPSPTPKAPKRVGKPTLEEETERCPCGLPGSELSCVLNVASLFAFFLRLKVESVLPLEPH